MDARLRTILLKDPIRSANLVHFAERYGIESFVIDGDSVLVRGTSDHPWTYLLPGDREGGLRLLRALTPGDHHLVGFDDWLLEALQDGFAVEWTLRCLKLVCPPGSTPEPPRHAIRPLVAGDAAYLFEHSDYQAYTDVPYIQDQITNGVGGGIEGPDGRLAAWALTHDDGAIGFLHVLEPFRHAGCGASLTAWMIQRVRERGGTPFVHIEARNGKSLSLARRSGFEPCGEVWWVKGDLKPGAAPRAWPAIG